MLVTTASFGELLVVPFQPEAPMTERLSWNTHVATSFNGTEQRVELLSVARQRFNLEYSPSDLRGHRTAFELAYGMLGRRMACGVWGEVSLAGVLAAGAVTAPADTDYPDWRVPGLALIWESPTKWELVEVSAAAAGAITFSPALTNSYTRAIVMPARIGYSERGVSADFKGFTRRPSFTFHSDEDQSFESEPALEYGDEELMVDGQLFEDEASMSEAFSTREDRFDDQTGLINRIFPWLHPKKSKTLRQVAAGPAEVRAFRLWAHRRKGRYSPLWLPSGMSDFTLESTGALTTFVTVADQALLGTLETRVHLAFYLHSGDVECRAITSRETSGGNTLLALDESLAVDASAIRQVSLLGLHRLDSDELGLDWVGAGVVECVTPVLEIAP